MMAATTTVTTLNVIMMAVNIITILLTGIMVVVP